MWYEHELDFIDKVGTPFQVTARLKPTSLEDLAAETNVAQIKGMVTVLGYACRGTNCGTLGNAYVFSKTFIIFIHFGYISKIINSI